MKKFYKRKKLFLLGIVILLYAFVITPLLVINLQKQQDTRSKASDADEITALVESQSALAMCTVAGKVELGVSFTNGDDSRSMTVTAVDQASGKSVNLGTVAPKEAKTGTIELDAASVGAGTVTFTTAWTDTPSVTEQKTATYNAISCQPFTPASTIQTSSVRTTATCGNATTDTVLITDVSGSMASQNKLAEAKNSARNFIDVVSQQESTNRVGLVTYATTATLQNTLTQDYTAVKNKVSGLSANGYTCIECGIKKANADIQTNGRQNVKKVVVLLTDGIANVVEGNQNQTDENLAEQKALQAALSGHAANGTVFFVIGFGSDVNHDFLKQLATQTGGKYYFPAPSELNGVYQEISLLIGKGILGGFTFNDANGNAAYDSGEQKFSGRSITLTGPATNTTVTTNNDGVYSMTGLCDGDYTLKQDLPSGWVQTLPTDPNGYSITINNASQFTDKNFGSKIAPTNTPTPTVTKTPTPTPTKTPTPTPTATPKPRCSDGIDNDNNGFIDDKDSTCHSDGNPKNPDSYVPGKDGERGGNTCADSKDNNNNNLIDGEDPVCHTDKDPKNPNTYDPNLPESEITTKLTVTVLLDGIGARGDNTNPTANTLSNKNPVHKTKPATIELYNTNNQLVAKGTGNITYNSTNGNFTGSVLAGGYLSNGNYYLKVKLDQYLRRQIPPGIQNIKIGQENKLPVVALVAGDVISDNKLNILDYNALLDCYSDLSAAPNCPNVDKKTAADINDDAAVNQVDYNLFIREIATQPGE